MMNSSTESSELLTRTTEKADKAKESLSEAMGQIDKVKALKRKDLEILKM